MFQTVRMPVPEAVREAIEYPKPYITPAIAAPILGLDPNAFRYMAREGRFNDHFPVYLSRSWVRVPKVPFLRAQGYEVSGVMEEVRG